ncbi:hypothetical protein [Catenuloplanes atrovinosus]|uniref:Uncharacterized protein n=1 Tax=Catenuloplanes atrovinosus TaxID=137266 RepID=A0AAE3YV44_9ACTN|nr:hypothetical protein [Catenuloplanes atrovinosus]MDR7280220.1 hypothetical protein [Catenuloplanes atrovinosus]
MPQTGPAEVYRRLVESRVWQEQRLPAVVLAATGLMAMIGMGSVAVAAAGWSTTTEVSVEGVTVSPSSAAPRVGVVVQTTLPPGVPPVAPSPAVTPIASPPRVETSPLPATTGQPVPSPPAGVTTPPLTEMTAPATATPAPSPSPTPSPSLSPLLESAPASATPSGSLDG